MKMEETEKLRTISEIAALLRESTKKDIMLDDDFNPDTVYSNSIFTKDEHELVKRKFLHLLNSL